MEAAERQNVTVKTYSAKDYVKDGLVAIWDGIENAGWHTHDPNISVWKDLVGKREIEIKPGRFTANAYHREKDDGNLVVPVPMSDHQTWELVFTLRNASSGNPRFIGTSSYQSMRYEVDGGVKPKLRFFHAISTSPVSYKTDGGGEYYGDGMYFLGGGICRGLPLYQNGVQIYRNDNYLATMYENYKFNLGAIDGTGSAATGDVHCFRLYNRELTAEEVMANYEIDKERFRL